MADLVLKLRFNPGGGSAIHLTAHKNLSILACTPMTSEKREHTKKIDTIRRETDGQRAYTEEVAFYESSLATGAAAK